MLKYLDLEIILGFANDPVVVMFVFVVMLSVTTVLLMGGWRWR